LAEDRLWTLPSFSCDTFWRAHHLESIRRRHSADQRPGPGAHFKPQVPLSGGGKGDSMSDRMVERPTFSINDYDSDGDVVDTGVYLHFGDSRIKVADSAFDFVSFINHLKGMHKEIVENW